MCFVTFGLNSKPPVKLSDKHNVKLNFLIKHLQILLECVCIYVFHNGL